MKATRVERNFVVIFRCLLLKNVENFECNILQFSDVRTQFVVIPPLAVFQCDFASLSVLLVFLLQAQYFQHLLSSVCVFGELSLASGGL